jgi:hypothetical protein
MVGLSGTLCARRTGKTLMRSKMTQYLRVSILGALPSGEKWSVNPHFICDPTGDELTYAQVTTIATGIAAAIMPNTVLGQWSTGTTLIGCRVEARGSSGNLENVVERLKTTPQVGSGTTPHPYQTSVVQTLKTATPGASGRGRLYWPATGVALDAASLRIIPSAVSSLLTGLNAYLAAVLVEIRATAPASSLVVFSRKNDVLSLVNATAVGDVVDTQRRRRDSLIENISTAAFAN